MDTNAELEALMLGYGLGRRDIARLLGKPLNAAGGYSNSTVDHWLSRTHQVPRPVLELLQLKLAERVESGDPWQRLLRQPVPYASRRDLERDLARVLASIRAGQVPKPGRLRKSLPLRRAGYLLELTAHLGGPDFARLREPLFAQANKLRRRMDSGATVEPFRAGEPVRDTTLDDLARRWRLAPGADIRRFRQLARTRHV